MSDEMNNEFGSGKGRGWSPSREDRGMPEKSAMMEHLANLYPSDTGLPFTVRVSAYGPGRPSVGISSSDEAANIRMIEGHRDEDLALLRTWLDRNQQVLLDYSARKIGTGEMAQRLVKV